MKHSNIFLSYIAASLMVIFSLAACSDANTNSGTSAESGSTLTVKGEILDLSCYMADGSKGKAHQTCAQGCLNQGLPAGILSDADGQVYLLIENHKLSEPYHIMLDHAAETVEITGTVVSKNGIQSLSVDEIKI